MKAVSISGVGLSNAWVGKLEIKSRIHLKCGIKFSVKNSICLYPTVVITTEITHTFGIPIAVVYCVTVELTFI